MNIKNAYKYRIACISLSICLQMPANSYAHYLKECGREHGKLFCVEISHDHKSSKGNTSVKRVYGSGGEYQGRIVPSKKGDTRLYDSKGKYVGTIRE